VCNYITPCHAIWCTNVNIHTKKKCIICLVAMSGPYCDSLIRATCTCASTAFHLSDEHSPYRSPLQPKKGTNLASPNQLRTSQRSRKVCTMHMHLILCVVCTMYIEQGMYNVHWSYLMCSVRVILSEHVHAAWHVLLANCKAAHLYKNLNFSVCSHAWRVLSLSCLSELRPRAYWLLCTSA
jgi:hypothetical protein